MAYDKTVIDFDAQPTQNEDGTLRAVKLTQSTRTVRKAEDGKTLSRGYGTNEDEVTIEIPVNKLGEVISELVGWATYFATGEAARDQRDPVAWPHSTATV